MGRSALIEVDAHPLVSIPLVTVDSSSLDSVLSNPLHKCDALLTYFMRSKVLDLVYVQQQPLRTGAITAFDCSSNSGLPYMSVSSLRSFRVLDEGISLWIYCKIFCCAAGSER